MTTTNANTTPVVCIVSLRVGHDTRLGFLPRFLREREELLARRRRPGDTAPAASSPPSTISTRSTSAVSAN